MSQRACLTFPSHFNTLERQVADQLPSPKRFAMPSLVSLGDTPSYVEGEGANCSTVTHLHCLAQIIMKNKLDNKDLWEMWESQFSLVLIKCYFSWSLAELWSNLWLISRSVPGFHNHRPEQRWHHQQGRPQGRAGQHGSAECEEWGAGGHGEGGQRPHQLHRVPDNVRREAEGCVGTYQLSFVFYFMKYLVL